MTVRLLLSLAALTVALAGPLAAQTPPASPAPAPQAAPHALPVPADGILARVQGIEIRQAHLDAAAPEVWEAAMDAYLSGRGPRTQHLRDVPRELCDVLEVGWTAKRAATRTCAKA